MIKRVSNKHTIEKIEYYYKQRTGLRAIDLGHVLDEIDHTVGVTPLVIVPRDELHEVIVQSDTGLLVEDGGAGIAQEVRGNNFLIGVTQNALQLALGSVLHGLADILIGGGLSQLDGQVHRSEEHTSELQSPS